MFDEILGVPAHPLLVHAAVVFVPLLVVGALAYALVPFVRRSIWWAVVGLAVVAPFAAWFATLSGNRLRTRLATGGISPEILAKIDQHRDYGDKTLWATIGLAVLTAIFVGLQMRRSWVGGATAGGTAGGGTVVGGTAGGGTAGVGTTGVGSGDQAARSTAGASSTGTTVVTIVLTVLLVFFAAASAYYVFKTGDTGAHSVWG